MLGNDQNSKGFAVGDRVRVVDFGFAPAEAVYTVKAVTKTHLTVEGGTATLTYRKERFEHA